MKNGKKLLPHFIAATAFAIFIVLGLACASQPEKKAEIGKGAVEKVSWSEYTQKPSKDYTVVGAVVIRNVNPVTLNADLMDQAVALGAHDIINVRLDVEEYTVEESASDKKTTKRTERRVVTASAVAIKYTDTTLKTSSSTTIVTDQRSVTESNENPIMAGAGSPSEASTSQQSQQAQQQEPQRKGFFGR